MKLEASPLHICLDISPVVHRKAGLGSYAAELTSHLLAQDSRDTFSVFHYGCAAPGTPADSFDALQQFSVPWGARRWRLSVAARHLLNSSMDASFPGIDVFHATEHLAPPLRSIRTVFTFHDAIYALFPQYHLPLNRLFLKTMMPRFLRQADAIIAVSECSKKDVVRLYSIDPARIQVIYEGVDPSFRPVEDRDELARVRAKYSLPDHFILFFSTIEPRKNLPRLLDAFRALLDRIQTMPDLVIAGKKGWLYRSVFQRVSELGLERRVHFTDWIEQQDAPVLLSAADVFILPSLYEGFGLPPLEAMACGTPVVCSNTSSLPEVVGNAALLVDPYDSGDIAAKLESALFNQALRDKLIALGRAQAAKFSWERTARETLQVYRDVGCRSEK